MSNNLVVLLLGSNIGDKKKNIYNAFSFLEEEGCSILKKSKFSITKPVEFVSSNNFCNIATLISTDKSPISLLLILKRIEKEMGRLKDSKSVGRYEDRIIDIDVVLFNNINFYANSLEIPHKKHLYQREFSKNLIADLEEY